MPLFTCFRVGVVVRITWDTKQIHTAETLLHYTHSARNIVGDQATSVTKVDDLGRTLWILILTNVVWKI